MRLITRFGVFAVLIGLLAACQVTITPFVPPDVDYFVTAQAFVPDGEQPAVQRSITVPARDEAWVLVSFGSSQADHRFVEVVPTGASSGVQLETWGDSGRRRQLVSRSPLLFGTTTTVLTSEELFALEVGRNAISSPWICFGPCIAERYRSGEVYVRVANTASTSRTVNFYAYGIDAWDTSSSDQGSPTVVDVLDFGDSDVQIAGAIETVDDVDYFSFVCPSTGPWFGSAFLTLEIMDEDFGGVFELVTSVGTYAVSETSTLVPCGSVVSVRSANGTAGPSNASLYTITAN